MGMYTVQQTVGRHKRLCSNAHQQYKQRIADNINNSLYIYIVTQVCSYIIGIHGTRLYMKTEHRWVSIAPYLPSLLLCIQSPLLIRTGSFDSLTMEYVANSLQQLISMQTYLKSTNNYIQLQISTFNKHKKLSTARDSFNCSHRYVKYFDCGIKFIHE